MMIIALNVDGAKGRSVSFMFAEMATGLLSIDNIRGFGADASLEEHTVL